VNTYSKSEIISGIYRKNNQIILWLYKQVFPVLENYIRKNGGTTHDAKDILQDAFLILYNRIRGKRFHATGNVPEYLYGICRNMWQDRFKHSITYQNFEDTEQKSRILPENMYNPPDPPVDTEEKKFALYVKHVSTLSKECRELLRFVIRGIPMREISKILGHPTVKVTYNQKSSCFKKLWERILNDPDYNNPDTEL